MRITFDLVEGRELSLAKASELGKTLSRGGITLADDLTAFQKRVGFR
mgnify:FL=1